MGLERFFSVVLDDRPDFHNNPSDSSSAINSGIRAVAAPYIASESAL
jgi:hypothetical protein